MFDAIQLFFKNLWTNILVPGLIFLAITGIIFAIGLFIGRCSIDSPTDDGSGNSGQYQLDREAQERAYIELELANTKLTAELDNYKLREAERNKLIDDSIRSISKDLTGLSSEELNSEQRLNRVRKILINVIEKIKVFRNP